MRINRFRAAGLAAAAGALALTAACGSGTPGQPADTGGDDAPEGATTVEFWQLSFQDVENEWYEAAVDAFNESQDEIHVNLTQVPGDAWEQRMTAAQAAGNAPDMYTIAYNGVVSAATTGQITSLSPYIGDDVWSDVQEDVLASISVEGEHYAFPMLVEPSAVLWYRTDLFEEAGIDGPPTTWEELQDYAAELTTGDVYGFGAAQSAGDMGWSTWGLQWNVAGHLPISDDWSEAQVGDEYAPLLQAWQDMYKAGSMPQQALAGYADANPLGEGHLAMNMGGSWFASVLINDFPEMVGNIGAAPMPSFHGDPEAPTATLGGWTWVVDAKSEVPEEAAAFIEATLGGGDDEQLLEYFAGTQFSKYSPRASVNEALIEAAASSENPWAATIAEQIVPFSKPEASYPWDISMAFATALEQAMQGTDVSTALADAEAEINRLIEANQLAGTAPQP